MPALDPQLLLGHEFNYRRIIVYVHMEGAEEVGQTPTPQRPGLCSRWHQQLLAPESDEVVRRPELGKFSFQL